MISTDTEKVLDIAEIEESNIINYFKTINKEAFEQTAALFAEDGQLLAPFEKPLVGRDAIASYLAKEATGMKLLPQRGEIAISEDNTQQVDITGKVKTSLFAVNVGWYFNLNEEGKINRVRVKLLASPQELLNLQKLKK